MADLIHFHQFGQFLHQFQLLTKVLQFFQYFQTLHLNCLLGQSHILITLQFTLSHQTFQNISPRLKKLSYLRMFETMIQV